MNELYELRQALRRACACCGVRIVEGFDAEFVRAGLCPTCRGVDEGRMGKTGDVLDRVHLSHRCPVARRKP